MHETLVGVAEHRLAAPDDGSEFGVRVPGLLDDFAGGGLADALSRLEAAADGEPEGRPGRIAWQAALHQEDASVRVEQQHAGGEAFEHEALSDGRAGLGKPGETVG